MRIRTRMDQLSSSSYRESILLRQRVGYILRVLFATKNSIMVGQEQFSSSWLCHVEDVLLCSCAPVSLAQTIGEVFQAIERISKS